jgi:FkbM family methyltransferase
MENNSFVKNLSKGISKRLKFLSANPYKKLNVNWFTLKYYKHLPPGKIRSHILFGKPFYFISATELLHGFDEIFVDEIYKQNLPANPYIIDCGANIGLSVVYMKQHYPDAEIIAFEPDEKNFDLLSKNVASFGYENITLRKEAVWKEDTILQFANEGSMSSKIETAGGANTKDVKATRLKNLLNKKIDFLKIDIEGAEFDVLKDVGDNLHLVQNLFLEYHGLFKQNNELTELIDLITKNGFSSYIKEATCVYETPFARIKNPSIPYDVQLNIFCFRV